MIVSQIFSFQIAYCRLLGKADFISVNTFFFTYPLSQKLILCITLIPSLGSLNTKFLLKYCPTTNAVGNYNILLSTL